ncbi:DUF2807 domain-containing protein [Cupriavidus basilensis]|uniref:DUF2807 domain-containing protein n=1 Tax=Cupriavidus basilensis TaxID=68895 RepID=A0ABT6AJ01_9BURK|nr:head GIN domain-containing protein [Cupriavidus basilensis]MDF3832577.1 DUF2807 domain-containing protein [Cupriavidus basilensis]
MSRFHLLRAARPAAGCLAGLAMAQQGAISVNQDTIATSGNSVVIVNGQVVSSRGAIEARGPETTELRKLGAFSAVQLNAPVEAAFSASPSVTLSITGPADILPLLRTTVADGRLSIDLAAPVVLTAPLKVAITAPSLQAIGIEGAGIMRATGLHQASLDIRLSGSGSIMAAGQAGHVSATNSGSGEVDASQLRAQDLDARLSGSGLIRGYASDAASVALNGSGDIVVAGNPPKRTVSRTGSGQVRFE